MQLFLESQKSENLPKTGNFSGFRGFWTKNGQNATFWPIFDITLQTACEAILAHPSNGYAQISVKSYWKKSMIFWSSLSWHLPPSGDLEVKFSDPKSVQFLKNLTFTPLQGLKKWRPWIRKMTITVDEIYLKEVPKISRKKKTRWKNGKDRWRIFPEG